MPLLKSSGLSLAVLSSEASQKRRRKLVERRLVPYLIQSLNLLLCQIALGNTKEAKKMVLAMTNEPQFPFRNKALELKQKLNW